MSFRVVIPARMASTRLPGKPLLDIGGKPMIEWVWRVAQESGADQVVIATDDPAVRQVALGFGADVCMTRTDHPSGTDRIAEVVADHDWADGDIIVNLQGDEPLLPAALVRAAVQALESDPRADLATLAHPIADADEFANPNVVKVVCDTRGRALYFSRAPVPFPRDGGEVDALRHIGLYAYRVGALMKLASLPVAPPEAAEQLEQLRALWNGMVIAVAVVAEPPPAGVDTAADLERVRNVVG